SHAQRLQKAARPRPRHKEVRVVLRFAAGTTILLLRCGVLAAGAGDFPVHAQDDDSGSQWPEIPTFEIPGTIQAPGTIESAGTVENVPGSIQVVAGTSGNATCATDIGIDLILDNSGSVVSTLGGTRWIDIARQVMPDLIEETLPCGIPADLRVL